MAIGPQGFVSIPVNQKSALGLTSATVIKPSKGFVATVTVVEAGTGDGAVADSASTSGISDANVVAVLPQVRGTYTVNFPCENGITVVPGTGQTLAVSYA